MEKEITVIIPFANEGEEVCNTVKSILQHSNDNVCIIAINDASDDGFDYEYNLKQYPIKYVVNESRLGVAASRDKGVGLCETKFFLLLDSHMRFYDSNWVYAICQELKANPKQLLCAQTKVLVRKNGRVLESKQVGLHWGAYINLYDPLEFLEPQWSFSDSLRFSLNKKCNCLIPCVLGAGYAMTKTYWKELNGLNGLLSYGSDETLISLKVWLSGGICKLMPNVLIGHIYRQVSPYQHYSEKRIYNRLLISDFLCPSVIMKKLCAIEKIKNSNCYLQAWKLYYQSFDKLNKINSTFKRYVKENFSKFEKFNFSHKYLEIENLKYKEKFLQKSILYIVSRYYKEKAGLVHGKLGKVILLFHYAKYTKNSYIKNLASCFLVECVKEMDSCIALDIAGGLSGLGWSIMYLTQNKILEIDANDILVDIDKRIMELSPYRVADVNFENGLGGILRYVLCRLYDVQGSKEKPFSTLFLQELYERAKQIMENDIYNNCPEVYVEFILSYEGKRQISPTSIYDILMLPGWNKFSKSTKDTSLHGLTGMCLEFILNKT